MHLAGGEQDLMVWLWKTIAWKQQEETTEENPVEKSVRFALLTQEAEGAYVAENHTKSIITALNFKNQIKLSLLAPQVL